MKQVNVVWLFFASIIFFQTVSAQDTTQSYGKFRVLLKNGDRIEVKKGKLTNTGLINFIDQNDQKEIPISDIRALDRRVGSKALLGAGIGLGTGLLGSLLGVAQVEADPNRKLKDNAGAIVAGVTVVCGLIGLIAGSAYDDWEKVPLNALLKADFNKGFYQLSMKIIF